MSFIIRYIFIAVFTGYSSFQHLICSFLSLPLLQIPICLHLYYISMKEQGVLSKLRFRHLSSRFPSGIFLNMNSNRLRHHIWTLFRMPLPKQLQFVQQSTLPTHFYLSLQTEICRFRFYSVLIAQNAAVFFLQRISTTNS